MTTNGAAGNRHPCTELPNASERDHHGCIASALQNRYAAPFLDRTRPPVDLASSPAR